MMARLDFPTIRKNKGDRLLTLNLMRNAHWGSMAKAKRDYAEHIYKFVESLPVYENKISIHLTLYFNDKKKKDLDNLSYPVMKFMADEMTKQGKIKDDDYKYLIGFSVFFGGNEEEDNYVMVEITEE